MTMATPERERPAGGPGAAGTEDRTLHGHHSAAYSGQQVQARIVAFWRLIGAAARRPDLARGDIAVLWAILDRVGDDGTAWPGYGRIAADTGLCRSTVTRSIRKLVVSGLLLRDSGGPGRSNRYKPGRSTDAPRCEGEPRRIGAARRRDESHVGAPALPGVGAPTLPEPASLNLPHEPASRRAKGGVSVAIPTWLPADAWQTWKNYRKAVGRKFTPYAQQLAIRRLESLRGEGHDPRKLIELAIESDWSSFNPRESTKASVTATPPKAMGAKAAMVRSETPLENAIGYIRQQHGIGAYGEGEHGEAEMRRLIAEATEKHRANGQHPTSTT